MSETDKITWIHLSDLHFGYEDEIGGTFNIRESLIKFLSTVENNKFKYLFISGDIFYFLYFYKKEKK
jgi:UDP-2,3-diacylglucosamine pyrophosphatase LpxH